MIMIMSKTIAKISYLVIFIISLILIIYILLLHGIHINNLVIPNADIKKLYIKLDKKLIVKADYVKIKKNYSKINIKSQLLSIKNYLKYFHLIFKELDIKKIKYENNTISLEYKNNIFFLETDQLYFLSTVSLLNKSAISIDIKKLYLKSFRTSFIGILNINLTNNKLEYDGTFFTHNLNAKMKLTLKNSLLQYYIYDAKSNNIAPFMDFLNNNIKINKIISNWIYKYIVAKDYDLNYLFGKVNIKTGEFFPYSMQGVAVAKDAIVKFNKKLPSVKIKKIVAKLKNDILTFKLFKPTYKKIGLNGSFVKITNLLNKGSFIEVIIKTTHTLDKKIKQILKAYNIKIPITQQIGKTSGIIKLTMPIVPFSMNIKGFFTATNSTFLFKNIKFYTKKAEVTLHNNIIKINNTALSYRNMFDINTTGTFNIKKDIYKGKININKLFIQYQKENLLNTKSKKSDISIDFKNNKISIPSFDTNLIFNKSNNYFIFNNLKKIYEVSPFLKKYDIRNGKAKLSTKDFKNYFLDANITYNQNILLYNNNKIKKFSITAKINKNTIEIKNKNIKANINNNNIRIQTEKISFDLRKLKNNYKSNISKPFTLNADDSTIYLNNISIPTENFTLFINKNKKVFSSIYQGNHILYSQSSKGTDINTNFITSQYLNRLIGHNLFHGGAFKLSITESGKLFKGNCKIANTIIKSIKKGGQDFKIDTGEFDFYLRNYILNLEHIRLKNDFSTLKGDGYIDLKNKKINLIFNVTILKNLGKTINSIPFLGYIILGQNGKFTSKVTISGNFDNPKIKTDFAENIIKSPINIIFRIIKTPFKLFLPQSNANPSK